jgi:hypothetical protein
VQLCGKSAVDLDTGAHYKVQGFYFNFNFDLKPGAGKSAWTLPPSFSVWDNSNE